MRYLLIDRVTHLTIDHSIRAVKNATLSEDVYTDHFFGYPVMPGAMMIESMGQAGTVLLEYSCKWTKKALLVMVEKAKFKTFVRPGDQLILELVIESNGDSIARLDGVIYVKDKPVADARLTFSLQDVEQFYPTKSRHFVQNFFDIVLEGATIIPTETSSKGQ